MAGPTDCGKKNLSPLRARSITKGRHAVKKRGRLGWRELGGALGAGVWESAGRASLGPGPFGFAQGRLAGRPSPHGFGMRCSGSFGYSLVK